MFTKTLLGTALAHFAGQRKLVKHLSNLHFYAQLRRQPGECCRFSQYRNGRQPQKQLL